MTDEDKPSINPGYPLAQLLKALSGAGEQAPKRIKQWQQVLAGLFDGSLQFGSRTPVTETPAWVTLEVVHGGFATGSFAASGPLQPYEIEKLNLLEKSSGSTNHVSQSISRSALNLYYVSDVGRPELTSMLTSGCFRVQLPEEGALLIATWLADRGEPDSVAELIEKIMPFFAQLRFYPEPHSRPAHTGTGVFIQTAGESVKSLRAKRPQASVQRMNEAINVWTPLYDRAVSLFLETVQGDVPNFQTTPANQLVRATNGQPLVSGGWPCHHYPADWAARASKLMEEYEHARRQHSLCKKPEKSKENFARLRTYLAKASQSPTSLTGRDVGMIRKILASYVTKHGAPGSERFRSTRDTQKSIVQRPLHHILAGVLADRLQDQPEDEGVAEVQSLLGPLSEEEAIRVQYTAGEALPQSVMNKAMRCLEAPLSSLVERRIVPSSEVLATALPLLTARIRVSSIKDPDLARVFESVYVAFRRRRSLLLFNLESQVRFEELPWISVLEPWVGSDQASCEAAHTALVQATSLAIKTFPQTILPNKLVKELKALAAAADISIPLVDELAADIFMGAFSITFLRAAQEAARLLKGSVYERYYGIDYDLVLKVDDIQKGHSSATSTSPGFADYCAKLADDNGAKSDKWSVARNGAIIEQSQILTTHNLAALFSTLNLTDTMRPELLASAQNCFKWICRRQQIQFKEWRTELQAIKNSAYAWRQMLFFLSMLDQSELNSFVDWCTHYLSDQPNEFRSRFAPALQGLELVARGERFNNDGTHPSGGRRFLGWSVGRHWLRAPQTSAAPES